MKNLLFAFICCSISLNAQQHKSPQEIQRELDQAERDLKRAEQMFNPWYTGPLLTPSATMMPPGYANIQPYAFINDNYAAFNSERKSISLPNSLIQFNPVNILQIGVTNNVDTSITIGTLTNWQDGHSGGGFSDITAGVGFLIQSQGLYVPKMKFSISETFPTGVYQRLRPSGLDGVGGGSYATQFSFAIGKLMFYSTAHPVNTRLSLAYTVSCPVKVHGFNAYGGGYGTKGTVHPGDKFSADLGIEVSLTQRWVFCNDFIYSYTDRTKFHGNPGRTASGGTAGIGKGYSDNFNLAPGIEYNWNENLGVLGGVNFSVYGRNSSNFVNAILSVEYTFPVGPWK